MNIKKVFNKDENKQRIKRIKGYSAYIYLSLAVCIVVALTIGVFMMSNNYTAPLESFPELSLPELSLPSSEESKEDEKQVGGEESDVDNEIIDPKTLYFAPIESGTVQKPYSMDALVFSKTMNDYRVHSGIDIAAPLGTQVRAYMDGEIADIIEDAMLGTVVVIEHDKGITTFYMNLAEDLPPTIVRGALVNGGDVIGTVGDTAAAECLDEPHLHFEIRVGGELIDPTPELEATVGKTTE